MIVAGSRASGVYVCCNFNRITTDLYVDHDQLASCQESHIETTAAGFLLPLVDS